MPEMFDIGGMGVTPVIVHVPWVNQGNFMMTPYANLSSHLEIVYQQQCVLKGFHTYSILLFGSFCLMNIE